MCTVLRCEQGLRQRIRDSYEARWRAEKHFDEEEIMEELPNSLRTEARCTAALLYMIHHASEDLRQHNTSHLLHDDTEHACT